MCEANKITLMKSSDWNVYVNTEQKKLQDDTQFKTKKPFPQILNNFVFNLKNLL